jgi:hypothetical protein
MSAQDMSDRELEDRAVEDALESLVEAWEDERVARWQREDFLESTPRPEQPGRFDNLQVFLDYYWQVRTYNNALQPLDESVTRAEEQYEEARRRLWEIFPMGAVLHYEYQGKRKVLERPYTIARHPIGSNPRVSRSLGRYGWMRYSPPGACKDAQPYPAPQRS